jgi:UDP-N-acetylmuramate: L-alanyl-gamma-D-glutamyl-meso-diaminopimelate ligase
MESADRSMVYFNSDTIKHKQLEDITEQEVKEAFGCEDLEVYTCSIKMVDALKKEKWINKNLLMMSSGNFNGLDFAKLGSEICD